MPIININNNLPNISIVQNLSSGLVVILAKGSWCPPCVALLEYLNGENKPWEQIQSQLQEKYPNSSFVFVDINENNSSQVSSLIQASGIRSIPTMIIVQNSKILGTFSAGNMHSVADIVSSIEQFTT